MDSSQDPARSLIPRIQNGILHLIKAPLPCSTKTALLVVNQKATKLHADAVGQAAQKIGTVSRDKYETLRVAAEKARKLSLGALETLDAHTYEHGC